MVLEKENFPRFRIGESLLPKGNAVLRAMGVWPKLERADFIPKHGAFFHSGDGRAGREILFSEGLVPGLDSTFQVERARFDHILLAHAREAGADVRIGATVLSVEEEADRVVLTYRQGGDTRQLAAHWLLDGSGRDRGVELPLKAERDPCRLEKRIAIYSHLKGVSRPAGLQAGHTSIVRLVDGWFWLIPIDAERTSVGLVTTTERFRASRLSPQAFFESEVASAPRLRELLAGATAAMPFHVTADYSYFHRRLADGRVLLLGDAAGFFDPIFSSGVYLALQTGQRAIDTLLPAHSEQRSLQPREARRYTRWIKRHAAVFERLILAFYDNASAVVFLQPGAPWGISQAINSIVAGHAELTWPLWWRFWAFLLICRVQRYFPFISRVGLERAANSGRPALDEELDEEHSPAPV